MGGNKFLGCTFCHRAEKGKPRHDKEVTSFVCSDCVQRLLQAPQAKLIEAYRLAIEKGYSEKAEWLKSFIEENVEVLIHDPKTGETRPSLVRERPVRKVRLTSRDDRA